MTIAEPTLPAELPAPNPDLLTYPEARAALGGVSHATVYRLAKTGEIDEIQIRRVKRFSRKSIEAFLKRQARKK